MLGTCEKFLISNIEAELKRLQWELTDLARVTKITRSGLYKIVKGQRWPGPDNLERIAAAFGRSPGWLLSDHTKEPRAEESPTAEMLARSNVEKDRRIADLERELAAAKAALGPEKSEYRREFDEGVDKLSRGGMFAIRAALDQLLHIEETDAAAKRHRQQSELSRAPRRAGGDSE